MNVFTLLKQDHKKVKNIFQDFEALGDRAHKQKEELVNRAIQELEVHTQIEEEIFYPAVKVKAQKEGQKIIVEAFEEHAVVKQLLKEIQELEPADEKYEAKFKVVMDSVKHHIKEEEVELFPKAKKALGDQAEEIGDQMEERKADLMSERGMEIEEMPKRANHRRTHEVHAAR